MQYFPFQFILQYPHAFGKYQIFFIGLPCVYQNAYNISTNVELIFFRVHSPVFQRLGMLLFALRAILLNFVTLFFFFLYRYAAKENDTWIRALVKDLTVETGSGLTVLDPVDVSGGYTSVKDKTNVSLVSTDVYIHLSLSVISLLLNLQTQAAAAIQFGNMDPLAPCTNFDRLWVSPKGAY